MQIDYVILTRPAGEASVEEAREEEQVFALRRRHVFLLPALDTRHYLEHGLFEQSLIEFAKQLCSRDKLTLDVGAHAGTYSINLAAHSRHVYAFEPQRSTYYALCGGVALSGLVEKITCLNCGLGSPDQVGSQRLLIRSIDGGGSTLHRSSLGDGEEMLGSEEIEVRTLDDWHDGTLPEVGFIKLDVEANELQVLQGAQRTIGLHRPKVLFEANTCEQLQQVSCHLEAAHDYRIVSLRGYGHMYLAEPR
jgi:FkbM family methyltransferase